MLKLVHEQSYEDLAARYGKKRQYSQQLRKYLLRNLSPYQRVKMERAERLGHSDCNVRLPDKVLRRMRTYLRGKAEMRQLLIGRPNLKVMPGREVTWLEAMRERGSRAS